MSLRNARRRLVGLTCAASFVTTGLLGAQEPSSGAPTDAQPLSVAAEAPSDPYLMNGFDKKTLTLSHDGGREIKFTIEIDCGVAGDWRRYGVFEVAPGQEFVHNFPDGFAANWLRMRCDRACQATAWLDYD